MLMRCEILVPCQTPALLVKTQLKHPPFPKLLPPCPGGVMFALCSYRVWPPSLCLLSASVSPSSAL